MKNADVVPTPLDLMRMHIDALYTHDSRERMQAINQWSGGAAPRFFLGRTQLGVVRRFRADVSAEVVAALEAIRGGTADPQRPAREDEYVAILASDAPVERIWAGPAFFLPPAAAPAAGPIVIDETNAELLRGGFEAWLPDVPHCRPFMALLDEGHAVAICASVRITPAAHEAGVETLRSHRGKGLAARVVAGWANAVRTLGALPLYSTSWDNTASQRVAAKLGAAMFGADFHVT